ncbi:MAG: UDP-2,4-diacetamido-2,4,6-trideoxy-beta-L-altropyranose hydrolase [Proteobacteria bacterium]|nr:UDP-2,4-diacetamido-2,4,6-trideoxy-beta-L-altropyranose hydrolase [Pseudomonadota bacterium]
MPHTILFRVDASLQIGTGHVMRCLALAGELRERGAECRFVCRTLAGNLVGEIERRGYQVHALPVGPGGDHPVATTDADPLHAAWLGVDWKTDVLQSAACVSGAGADWLVIDHYALDARWECGMRSLAAQMMVIDDLADRPHACDLLLDQTLGRQASAYQLIAAPECGLMLGPSYALLRPEFTALRGYSLARRTQPDVQHLLVSLGGVDRDDQTSRVLEALQGSKLPTGCRITVVMGAQAPALHAVQAKATTMKWATEVRVDVLDMAALMADCDLAIGASGGSAWERCCMGIPTLAVVAATNQREGAAALHTANAAWNLGDTREADFDRALATAIDRCLEQPGTLRRMSEIASALIDGNGATRVALTMLARPARAPANATDRMRLRPATLADAEMLLAWRNEASTRHSSHDTATIALAEHLRWLESSLANPCRCLLVAEIDGTAMGTARADLTAGVHVLSWTVPEKYRSRGIGKEMVRMLVSSIAGPVRAEIRRGNHASIRTAVAAGLHLVCEQGDVLHFIRETLVGGTSRDPVTTPQGQDTVAG